MSRDVEVSQKGCESFATLCQNIIDTLRSKIKFRIPLDNYIVDIIEGITKELREQYDALRRDYIKLLENKYEKLDRLFQRSPYTIIQMKEIKKALEGK